MGYGSKARKVFVGQAADANPADKTLLSLQT